MFSVRSLTSVAKSAMRAIAPSVNRTSTPSVESSAMYCLISAFLGSVRMRTNSSRPSASSSTRIGNRPCSSGIRSDGFETWNAPAAMNRMWSVFTIPYLVFTVVPSTIGRMSRCTPSRLTSGPWLPSRPATLSISSMKMMPACCDALDRGAGDAVHVDELLLLFLRRAHSSASGTRSRRFRVRPWNRPGSMSLTLMSTSSTDVPGDDLERGKALFAHVDLDLLVIEPPRRAAARGASRACAAPVRESSPPARRARLPAAAAAAAGRAAAPRRLRAPARGPRPAALREPCRRRAPPDRGPSTRRRGRRSRPR